MAEIESFVNYALFRPEQNNNNNETTEMGDTAEAIVSHQMDPTSNLNSHAQRPWRCLLPFNGFTQQQKKKKKKKKKERVEALPSICGRAAIVNGLACKNSKPRTVMT